MKIVILGGTGQVGRILCRAFASAGDEVVALTRKANPECSCRCVQWDGESVGDWARELEDAAAVINLAGRSVNCRYGKKNRREILDSRVNSVHAIRSALEKAPSIARASERAMYIRIANFSFQCQSYVGAGRCGFDIDHWRAVEGFDRADL
jgi:NAD dependent epimerase/dehydratase family enzyme